MRIGIIGTGFMGQTHAAAWTQTPAEIGGLLGETPATAEALAGQYSTQVYTSFDELLADADVVDICTPTHLHHPMVLQAAQAGKDIICEKPLARTVANAREMINVCQDAGVKLLVAHVVRFFPEYAQAHAKVAAGDIGDPAIVRLRRGTFQPKKSKDNWFVDFDKSGGMMLDLMIHDFDYARWVAGDVESVYAQKISSAHPGAAVDHGLAILTHRSGAISHVEGSWAYPPPLFRTQLEIAGSNGWLRFDSDGNSPLSIHLHVRGDDAPDVPLPGSPLAEDPYATQLKSFYYHLAEDRPTPVSAQDGLAALQIALAAIESAETGQPVQIEAGL